MLQKLLDPPSVGGDDDLLSKLTKQELNNLKSHKIYTGLSNEYHVDNVIQDWFGNFENLEKDDAWRNLSVAERAYAVQREKEKIEGVKNYVEIEQVGSAFNDASDENNLGLIPMVMKKLSNPEPVPSEKSFSSGSGNYEEDAKKETFSDDSDLAMIK